MTKAKFLVVGSGAREHALCWKLGQDSEVHCAPGNPGIREDAIVHEVESNDFEALKRLALKLMPVIVLIGPEDPLISGLADYLRSFGILVFGPSKAAAELEGSKAFSKFLMRELGIKTPDFVTFDQIDEAKKCINGLADDQFGIVVKASGNALGKGVVVCESKEEAEEVIEAMMTREVFGDAGKTIVIEQKLQGFEFSLLTLVSDYGILSLPIAQDYKRAKDCNLGPNTGGMGSCSPLPSVNKSLIELAEHEFVLPVVNALKTHGRMYRGVLFSGVMVDHNFPFCLEYNVRFGDPETQSVLLRLGKGFSEAIAACAKGEPIPEIEVLDNAAVTVVIASEGYPESPIKGIPISSIPTELSGKVFHAGTMFQDGQLITSGGRVFSASASGVNLEAARANAYQLADKIHFQGSWFRSDIGD